MTRNHIKNNKMVSTHKECDMDLKDYFDKRCISVREFCRRIGCSPMALDRIMKKGMKDIILAKKIYDLTDGEVGFDDLIPPENKTKEKIDLEPDQLKINL